MVALLLLLAAAGGRFEDTRWGFVLDLPDGWAAAPVPPRDPYAAARFVPEDGGAEILVLALPDLPAGGRLSYESYARQQRWGVGTDGEEFRLRGEDWTGRAWIRRGDDADFAIQLRTLDGDAAAHEAAARALVASFRRTVVLDTAWHMAPVAAPTPGPAPASAPAWASEEERGDATLVDVFYGTTRERAGRRAGRIARWLAGFAAVALAAFVLGKRRLFERPAVWAGVVAASLALLFFAVADGFPLLAGLSFLAFALAPRTLHCLLRPRWHWMVRGARVVFGLATLATFTFAASGEYRVWDQQRRVQLAYGTRRFDYGGAWGCETGVCTVSIPEDRADGEIPLPWLGLPDPAKHFLVRGVEVLDADAFRRRVAERAGKSPRREALLFVHGYNNSFNDAVFRAAQIAHDLEFPGAPILFSWPSKGDFLRYSHDEAEVIPAGRALGRFLAGLQETDGVDRLYVIAHSMGCRVLGLAMQWMRSERHEKPFDVVVLAAPDIDAEAFRDVIAPEMRRRTERPTLYVSRNDSALKASYGFHGYRRAGDAAPVPIVVDGIDTIDVSAISADHSYIGSNFRVMADLGALLDALAPATKRMGPHSALRFDAERGYFWMELPR